MENIIFVFLATRYLKRADESSHLITIIVSVLAFVILGIGVAVWFFLVYQPRKNGMSFPSYIVPRVVQQCSQYERRIEIKRAIIFDRLLRQSNILTKHQDLNKFLSSHRRDTIT